MFLHSMYKNPSWRYTLAFTHEIATDITVDSYVLLDCRHCFTEGCSAVLSIVYQELRSFRMFMSSINVLTDVGSAPQLRLLV